MIGKWFYIVLWLISCYPAVNAQGLEGEVRRLVCAGDSLHRTFHQFQALKCYEEAYKLHAVPLVSRRLAGVYAERGENRKSLDILCRMPSDSLTHTDLRLQFNLYHRLSENDSMSVVGRKILRRYPYDAEIVGLLANQYNRLEQPDSALACTQQYVRSDSTNQYVNEQRAYALFLKGKYEDAKKLYQRLIQMDSHNSSYLYYGGLCLAQSVDEQDLKQALRYLQKASFMEKNKNPYILLQLGILYSGMKEDEKAVDNLQTALYLLEPRPEMLYELYNSLATSEYRLHHYTESIDALKKVLNYKSGMIYTYFRLGQTYAMLKNTNMERQYYQQFVNLADAKEDLPPLLIKALQEASDRLKQLKEEEFFKNGIPKK